MNLFHQNLSQWQSTLSEEDKENGVNVEPLSSSSLLTFCFTQSGEANLKREGAEGAEFIHSEIDPHVEAKEWFSSLDLAHIQVIYLYGIGLGYYYDAVRDWLKEKRDRYLIVIEDDHEVMRCFLETERCRKVLNDPQVVLCLLGKKSQLVQLTKLISPYAFSKYIFTPLKSKEKNSRSLFSEYQSIIAFMTSMSLMLHSESLSHGIPFFRNFFLNYLNIPTSYLANGLLGKFEGVPAIICGAGPSLNKNIDVLATLHDRALIFAGGTALNALNGKGVMPHFGVGIDPNPDQYTRLVMNHAFELPFLYRCRMLHEALKLVHGDRLYLTGSGGYEIGKWIEKKLGMDEYELEEGFNVLNFSVMIAHAMGCNPIICVGVDLAYSPEGESYGSGVISHPIHNRKDNFRTKGSDDELLLKRDIYGKPVSTLWKWIAESIWYSHFASTHPKTLLLNATEGGIGFSHVLNLTLEEVKKEYLQKPFDLINRLHGEIQNSPLPATFSQGNIDTHIRDIIDSLVRCGNRCQTIGMLLLQAANETGSQQALIDKIKEEECQLFEETAYDVMLKRFDQDYLKRQELDMIRHRIEKDVTGDEEHLRQKAILDSDRYLSLKETCFLNGSLVYGMLDDQLKKNENKTFTSDAARKRMEALRELYPHPLPNESENDQISFPIDDSDLKIERLYYPSGKVKLEKSSLGNFLHGPSYFYSEHGGLLASSWFIQGKREGKTWTYYPDGALHSLRGFREGEEEGVHQYFYQNGLPKSMLPYQRGELHGEVLLFSPEGFLIRKLQFKNGKRTGQEQIWNENGGLMIEAHFEDDRPVGETRMWHSNGMLSKEMVYDQNSGLIQSKEWDKEGVFIERDSAKNLDYFEQVNQETNKLTGSLNDMVAKMAEIAPLVSEKVLKDHSEIQDPSTFNPVMDLGSELENLKNEMKHLELLGSEINVHLTGGGDGGKEAIWKTPSSRHEMEKQFEAIREKMNADLGKIQEGIKGVIQSIGDQDKKLKP